MTSIKSLLPKKLPEVYNNPSFIHCLESFLPNIETELLSIELIDTHRYERDFYGLLSHYVIPPEEHYLTLRLNGLTNPNQYKEEIGYIKIAKAGQLVRLRKLFKTTYQKK